MKTLFTALFLFLSLTAFSQSKETKELLTSIDGKWKVNDLGYLEYERVIEVPGASKDELYNRAINFLHQAYNNSSQTIKQQDKTQGRIFARGIFANLHTAFMGANATYSANHSVQVDTKDGKARIIVLIDGFANQAAQWGNSYSVSEMYPINEKNPTGTNKTASGKAFYAAHQRAVNLIEVLEGAVRGALPTTTTKEDW